MSAEALSPERAFEVWDGITFSNVKMPWPETWHVRVVPQDGGPAERWTVGIFDTREDAEGIASDLERHAQAIRAATLTKERNQWLTTNG